MSRLVALPAPFVDEAAALVRRRTGLVVGASRREAFQTALVEAMCAADVHDPVVYLADLAGTPALMDELAGRVAVGETYFFREPEQLSVIEREILPSLLSSRAPGDGPVRVWSAGCATGEEPYTLAIVASRLGAAERLRILGTDISRRALAKARAARYPRWSLRGVAEEVVRDHFQQVGSLYEVHRAHRDAVEFQYLNLADEPCGANPPLMSRLDLILCRNVLIYFDRDTVARVAARLVAALAPGGWLVLGASDPMIADLVACTPVATGAGLMYRSAGEARAVPVQRRDTPDRDRRPAREPWRAERPLTPDGGAGEEPSSPPVVGADRPTAPAAADPGTAARFLAAGDYDRAVEQARAAAERDGDDAGNWVVLVRALAGRGDLAAAERTCAAALERHPLVAELHCLHALCLNEARQYEAAAAAARRALYLGRESAVAHLAFGAALAGLGDRPTARLAFGSALRLLGDADRDAVVPASGGEPAWQLRELAQAELQLLAESAA